jgi:hypothetical protein
VCRGLLQDSEVEPATEGEQRPLEVTMFRSLLRSFARSAGSFTLAATGSVFLCSGVSPARAQQATSYVADIPFAFHMNGETLPAGKYRITPNAAPQGLRLNEIDGKHAGFVLVYHGDDAHNVGGAVIRFNRYGTTSFLRDFSTEPLGPGRRSVSRCNVTREEKRVARDWVQTRQTFGPVTTVALNAYPQH